MKACTFRSREGGKEGGREGWWRWKDYRVSPLHVSVEGERERRKEGVGM